MERKKLRTEITHLIDSIKEHSDDLTGKENIPQLKLEMILHKIEKLYELSIVFNYLYKLEDKKIMVFEDDDEGETEIKRIVSAEEEKKEEIKSPTNLFGEELPVKEEKPKVETKVEKKPESNVRKPGISNIKTAIGINEKFQFLNQLFAGNTLEFDTAIQQLNTAESKESAIEYLYSLVHLYKWDEESEVFKTLAELVTRRYS